MSILIEKTAPKSKVKSKRVNEKIIQLWGKSPWLQSVVLEVKKEDEKKFYNKIIDVKIIKSRPSSLIAEIL